MTDSKPVRFPCANLPEAPAEARLLGVYPQRAEGLLMQRVKAPQGRLTLHEWQGLAQLAARYTPEYPLHVTTRQDVELHGVRPADVPAVQQEIDRLGLSGAATGGDSVRNIAVCPCNGRCPCTWDVGELVRALGAAVESLPWRADLPRKFKISVSGCRKACGRPWINDLGLAANPDGSFRVVLAGSLGPEPALGVLAYESLPPDEVLPLAVAVLRLFYAEGDRAKRGRARLRHLRQRLGTDVFLSRVEEFFQRERREGRWRTPTLRRVESAVPPPDRLCLPLGDIDPGELLELVEAVRAAGGEVRLGMCHDLLIFAETTVALGPRLAAWRGKSPVVACPGAAWCTRGLADSRAAASRVRQAMPDGCGLLVGITGCPNNCAQAATADIGLVGRLQRMGEARVERFRLLAGGGKGETPVLASELHAAVPAEKVHEAVAWLVQAHQRAQSNGPMPFAGFVAASADGLRGELGRRYGAEHIA